VPRCCFWFRTDADCFAQNQLINEIKTIGRKAVVAYANVAKRNEVESVVATSVENLGPLNLMVANAGIAKVQWMMDSTEEDWKRVFDVNVFGVVNCNIAAAKQFIRQGTSGKILNAGRYVFVILYFTLRC